MVWDLVVWLSSFLVVGGLLGIVVYQLMCLSDLEFDYVNPFEAASRINVLVIPEFGLQGCLSIFFLLTGHWAMFLINTPIIYYHCNLYLKKSYEVDVTEIFRDLGSERKLRLMKLAFYLLLFFLIIYKYVLLFPMGLPRVQLVLGIYQLVLGDTRSLWRIAVAITLANCCEGERESNPCQEIRFYLEER